MVHRAAIRHALICSFLATSIMIGCDREATPPPRGSESGPAVTIIESNSDPRLAIIESESGEKLAVWGFKPTDPNEPARLISMSFSSRADSSIADPNRVDLLFPGDGSANPVSVTFGGVADAQFDPPDLKVRRSRTLNAWTRTESGWTSESYKAGTSQSIKLPSVSVVTVNQAECSPESLALVPVWVTASYHEPITNRLIELELPAYPYVRAGQRFDSFAAFVPLPKPFVQINRCTHAERFRKAMTRFVEEFALARVSAPLLSTLCAAGGDSLEINCKRLENLHKLVTFAEDIQYLYEGDKSCLAWKFEEGLRPDYVEIGARARVPANLEVEQFVTAPTQRRPLRSGIDTTGDANLVLDDPMNCHPYVYGALLRADGLASDGETTSAISGESVSSTPVRWPPPAARIDRAGEFVAQIDARPLRRDGDVTQYEFQVDASCEPSSGTGQSRVATVLGEITVKIGIPAGRGYIVRASRSDAQLRVTGSVTMPVDCDGTVFVRSLVIDSAESDAGPVLAGPCAITRVELEVTLQVQAACTHGRSLIGRVTLTIEAVDAAP